MQSQENIFDSALAWRDRYPGVLPQTHTAHNTITVISVRESEVM